MTGRTVDRNPRGVVVDVVAATITRQATTIHEVIVTFPDDTPPVAIGSEITRPLRLVLTWRLAGGPWPQPARWDFVSARATGAPPPGSNEGPGDYWGADNWGAGDQDHLPPWVAYVLHTSQPLPPHQTA